MFDGRDVRKLAEEDGQVLTCDFEAAAGRFSSIVDAVGGRYGKVARWVQPRWIVEDGWVDRVRYLMGLDRDGLAELLLMRGSLVNSPTAGFAR